MTRLQVCRDPQELYEEAATLFVRLANEAVATRGRFTVALSGGSTPKGVYAVLAGAPDRTQLAWSHIHLFWGDERCVSPTHPDSNYRMAAEALIMHLPVPAQNIHRMPVEYPPDQAASMYERTLRESFALPLDALPCFDLVFLGLGGDGHTASLFPGTPGLHESTRLVVAQYVEKLAAWRVTLTPRVLNRAASFVFLVCGVEKAPILKTVLQGPFQPEQFPAQLICPPHGALLWLVDQAAASLVVGKETGSGTRREE